MSEWLSEEEKARYRNLLTERQMAMKTNKQTNKQKYDWDRQTHKLDKQTNSLIKQLKYKQGETQTA